MASTRSPTSLSTVAYVVNIETISAAVKHYLFNVYSAQSFPTISVE